MQIQIKTVSASQAFKVLAACCQKAVTSTTKICPEKDHSILTDVKVHPVTTSLTHHMQQGGDHTIWKTKQNMLVKLVALVTCGTHWKQHWPRQPQGNKNGQDGTIAFTSAKHLTWLCQLWNVNYVEYIAFYLKNVQQVCCNTYTDTQWLNQEIISSVFFVEL